MPAAVHSWSLAVHGGAGGMTRATLTPTAQAAARAGLHAALVAGAAILGRGGSAVDAVAAAVAVLEDDPMFNAGRGAVFAADGAVELDAAIMDGATRRAGAVARVTGTRSPVALARAVMAQSPHVMLAGVGADAFALTTGLEQVANDWFKTDARRRQFAESGGAFDRTAKFGTVGAVARDAAGHLAAATSTGGVTGKKWGRIGDSPLIGAGTYADAAVAVSATGSGEDFMRAVAAHEISALVRLTGMPVAAAAATVLGEIAAAGGAGGVIAMPAAGTPALPFTTAAMYRGTVAADTTARVAIFADEDAA